MNVVVDRSLAADASSVGEARRLLRQVLPGPVPDDWVEAAQLVVSELVTNSLVHAGTAIHLKVQVNPDSLRIEVGDGNPHQPHLASYSAMSGTGRGLKIVDQTVTRWGSDPVPGGKVVWFELRHFPDPAPLPLGCDEPADPVGSATMASVELRNVPLLMHAAWQEHGAGLLREYLLVTLNEEPAALETHAAASDALAILAEQIPSPRLGQDPDALMAESVEPHVSRDALTLHVPLDAVAHFRVLDETLTAAVALADAGKLLSAPTQPEIRSLRHWICQQVAEQSAGGSPAPWDPAPHRAAPPVAPVALEWDTSAVNNSDRAIVAADDTNSIVAASRAALDILRYRHRSDLVGRRIVSIIPPRYHQAHLAGFTLHLASDRSPLLGRPINVPVLRSDGTEEVLELLVEAHLLPHGRRVFTAVFNPDTPRVDAGTARGQLDETPNMSGA